MRILILTEDKYLKRKLTLELRSTAEVSYTDSGELYDAVIVDTDTHLYDVKSSGRRIPLSRTEGPGILKLPLPLYEIKNILTSHGGARLSLDSDSRLAILDGATVKLTAHEYALLSLLMQGAGKYISRESISESVFGGAQDGLINIYIHYLRNKLETNGEKIIIASRKLGYKIDEKYIRR